MMPVVSVRTWHHFVVSCVFIAVLNLMCAFRRMFYVRLHFLILLFIYLYYHHQASTMPHFPPLPPSSLLSMQGDRDRVKASGHDWGGKAVLSRPLQRPCIIWHSSWGAFSPVWDAWLTTGFWPQLSGGKGQVGQTWTRLTPDSYCTSSPSVWSGIGWGCRAWCWGMGDTAVPPALWFLRRIRVLESSSWSGLLPKYLAKFPNVLSCKISNTENLK